jgi:hypothetical protein
MGLWGRWCADLLCPRQGVGEGLDDGVARLLPFGGGCVDEEQFGVACNGVFCEVAQPRSTYSGNYRGTATPHCADIGARLIATLHTQ